MNIKFLYQISDFEVENPCLLHAIRMIGNVKEIAPFDIMVLLLPAFRKTFLIDERESEERAKHST